MDGKEWRKGPRRAILHSCLNPQEEGIPNSAETTTVSLNQLGSPSETGQYLQHVSRKDREIHTQTYTPHIAQKESVKETVTDRSQNRERPLVGLRVKHSRPNRKRTEMLTEVSLGCEMTRVSFSSL